jgi:hypothetical protein
MLPSEPSTVTIATADTPPVADAGSGQNVVAGTAVTLDAGGSSDADRHPLQESWAILSRPANSKATLSSSTDVSPSFVPDVPGAYVVQLMVSDGRMNSAPTTAFFTASPLTITTTTLPSAQIGIPYSQALAATGGTPPYFWTVAHGRLPGNFSLDPITGIIGGTAQFTSTSFLTIQVTDSASPAQTATTQLTLAFVQPGLTIVTTSLPAGQKNVPYSQTLVAAGGVQPYTWSLTSGSLPTGWTLNPASGLISGSASIAVANSAVTVRVADSAGSFTTQGLSINVVDGALTITTQSLPNGVVGAAYSAALAASGGIGSLTWQLTAGSLPAGLSLSTGGLISGTPSAPASAVPLSFQVTDSGSPAQTASVNLSLTIGGGLGITTVSLPNGSVGSPYSFVLAAAGGQGTLTWQLTAGVLPAGLSLDASTGTISGTPSSPAGPVPLTFKVTDSASQSAMANLFLTIQGGSLTITTTSLPDGYIGLPYSKQLTATGGTAPYSWSIASGRLPGGFTFDGSTGTIGGSPQFTDPASVTFRVTDSLGQTATANLSVAIYALSFSIVTNALPSGQVNVPYSFALQGIGGVTPYTWTTTSGLPAGMFLNASTGVIGGTPSTTSSSRVTFRLTDSSPVPQSVNASFTLTITGTAFVIVTPSLATGSVGSAYSQVLAATGGTGALTWQLTSGALPAGLTLNAATGLISGTPTASANAVPLSLKATDSSSPAQVATASYTLTIAGNALTITTPSLASGVVGTPYLQTLAAVGGSQPYTWQLTSGTLPAGLSFNTAGQISGTPTASVTAAPLTFKVTDAGSQSASANFGLTIATGSGTGSLTVVTTSLPPALVGVPYSQTLTATGGTLPYTWSLPTGRLPGGFNISPSGTISGTADPANQPDGFLDPLLLGFRVTDSSTPPQSVTVMLTFTITKPALQIVTTILPNGTVGVPYSFTMQASGGGSGIYTWAVQSGVLPSGLSLDPASGVISGTPSATMVRRVIISVTDPAPPPQVFGGSLQTVSASFTLAVQ